MSDAPSNDGSAATAPPAPARPRLIFRLRSHFFTGVLVTAPISITIYISWLLISWVDSSVLPFIPTIYNPETYLPFSFPGIGLIFAVIVLTMIGAITTGLMGRMFIRYSERVLNRMPVVRSIYSAVKPIVETMVTQKSAGLREVVMLEFPRLGQWSLGFVTGVTQGEIQELTEDEVVNVYIPTTPNPTSGYLLFVPRRDLVPIHMSVEDGIKLVISGGIVTPPDRRPPSERGMKIRSQAPAASEPLRHAGE